MPTESEPTDFPADAASLPTADAATGPAEGALPELRFRRPLPGFPGLERFVLVSLDDALYELRSLDQPAVRFLVGVPSAFFADYTVELDDAAAAELQLDDAADALVLVVLNVGNGSGEALGAAGEALAGEAPAGEAGEAGAGAGEATANLLAPIVINARTRDAAQVILSGTDWPVRAPIG